jgi:hypothetical protein
MLCDRCNMKVALCLGRSTCNCCHSWRNDNRGVRIAFGDCIVHGLTIIRAIRCHWSICGRPPPRKVFRRHFDQIACVHMSGLLVRSHMNAGQDGFRDPGPKQQCDLEEGHWVYRSVPRRGSIDHTICSFSCKFWHRLSTVAVSCSPCLADLWNAPADADGRGLCGMALFFHHDRPRDGSRAAPRWLTVAPAA